MSNETVKVIVRCRPMNQNELNRGSKSCVEIVNGDNQVILKTKEGDKSFTYDNVFTSDDKQETVYNKSGFSLVESVVNGYNGTIFAYGQTGCGKTHTMMGYSQCEVEKGIIPRTFDQVVKIIKQQAEGINYLVRCSFIEIYNEEIHDLLAKDVKQKLDLKGAADGKVYVKDLNMICVKTVDEMEHYMNKGNGNRTTGETLMNKDSSRSHSIFTLYVEQSQIDDKGNDRITLGKLNLVDLAGSERLSKTGAQGDRLKEATKINLSLSALGNVISALVDGKSGHIPYRDSKLTRLLQDSLGGNTKTIMIAAISPADYNLDETLGTLRYASRAKNIKNKPKVNEDPKDALLKEYSEEIKRLKAMLENQNNNSQINFNMDLQIQNISQINTQQTDGQQQQQTDGQQQQQQQQQQQTDQIMNQLQNEKVERQKLEDMIVQMQQNVVQGGGANEEQKQQYQEFKSQLEKQEQQRQLLIQEKQMQEEEYLQQNLTYQSMQEEVEHLRKVCTELQKKNISHKQEIKDIQHECVVDKVDLNENMKIQQKQLKIYQQIVDFVFKKEEIKQMKYLSEWSDLQNDYMIPQIQLVDKKLKLPKLNQQRVENDRNNKEQENRYQNNQRTPSTNQNTRVNYHKAGYLNDSDDDLNYLKKSNLSNTYNVDNKTNIYEQESKVQNNPIKNQRKLQLEPIKSTNISCNEYAKINGRINKLQPLQGNNKQNKMQVNFKATIHINNNGNIFY